MKRTWEPEQAFDVAMPHMVPGKLSEVELLKQFGAAQWESIARLIGCRPNEIVSRSAERLYASFLSVELRIGDGVAFEAFPEGERVVARHSLALYARRFVEALFVFGQSLPADLDTVASDLRVARHSWVRMTTAFVARTGSDNSHFKIFEPERLASSSIPSFDGRAPDVELHEQVERTGHIELELELAGKKALPLVPRSMEPICYEPIPESDFNGVGLVYFARYVAILNYADRLLLTERLARPLSSQLVGSLSTQHRRLYYFANANVGDRVRVFVRASLIPSEPNAATFSALYRTPWKLQTRADMYRASDGRLMASSLAVRSLNVPADAKSALAEAERYLRQARTDASP